MISLTNETGLKIFDKVIEHYGASATYTIEFPKMLTNGIYQLQLTGGEINIIQKIIKN